MGAGIAKVEEELRDRRDSVNSVESTASSSLGFWLGLWRMHR